MGNFLIILIRQNLCEWKVRQRFAPFAGKERNPGAGESKASAIKLWKPQDCGVPIAILCQAECNELFAVKSRKMENIFLQCRTLSIVQMQTICPKI